ncbi:MAG TPA: hypothetical protein QGH16_02655 [Verrucomicrobiota bacterium]|jgi:hypothetical protein|nr:hypothetical protein [Verrucomicrobiota bacterium]
MSGKPVRGPVSAQWCLAGVDRCWKSKQNTYSAGEHVDAKAAYDHDRKVFKQLVGQAEHE